METERDIQAILSQERFDRYLTWAGGDCSRALALYALNTQLSEALYTPLQMLEITLRNRIHTVMSAFHGERWFEMTELVQIETQRQVLAKALDDLVREGKPPEPGRVVAALTFSFWTSMFSPTYEQLWRASLHQIAQRDDKKSVRRKDLSGALTPIRILRNRIAHHEPIISWNLRKHNDAILRITGWLAPAAEAWARQYSRFDTVWPKERILPTTFADSV